MTSAHDRPSERASERTPSVQTLLVEEGRLEVSLTVDLRNAIFSRRDLSEKRLICICYINKRSGMLIKRLKEQCHEDFAVLSQLCAEIITLRLKS